MKYLDEYRDPVAAGRLLDHIRLTASHPWVLMEVCGGQTHSLLKHGIEAALDGVVELIHGPGCPVCVTPAESIEFARALSRLPGVLLCSFGDMLRVPGCEQSLLDARAAGGQVRIVYSPLDAVALAQQHPERQVVFFAVGFETTAPATALAVLQAEQHGLSNFSMIVDHVRVQPAMEAILEMPENRVQGFLAAGHVCTVMGYDTYDEFVERYGVPVVVTGFEPLDLLRGILECVRLLEVGKPRAVNAYARSVRTEGNTTARQIVHSVYEIADGDWRGLGPVRLGGLRLRERWKSFDARSRFPLPVVSGSGVPNPCRAGDVLSGRIRPTACSEFGVTCTPESPLGAPMVSSEGACAAYYRHRICT